MFYRTRLVELKQFIVLSQACVDNMSGLQLRGLERERKRRTDTLDEEVNVRSRGLITRRSSFSKYRVYILTRALDSSCLAAAAVELEVDRSRDWM